MAGLATPDHRAAYNRSMKFLLATASLVGSLALEGLGILLLCIGLFGGTGSSSGDASLLGIGALAMMFGVALLAPVLVRPLAGGRRSCTCSSRFEDFD